jgi:hypothetical protein
VNIETRRQKQQELMVRIVERKVRERAQQLYEARGQKDGWALQDWFQAESEILENTTLAALYRRLKSIGRKDATVASSVSEPHGAVCESPV